MLSMAIDQDVNAFVAARSSAIFGASSEATSAGCRKQVRLKRKQPVKLFMKHGSVPTPKQLHRPVEQNQMKIHRPFRLQNQKV